MKLKLIAMNLANTYQVLYDLKLQGRLSFTRSILCNKFLEKGKEIDEERTSIAKSFALLNDSNELILVNGNELQFENDEQKIEHEKAVMELMTDTVILDCSEHETRISELFDFIENSDLELSGIQAELLFNLIEGSK